MPTLGVVVFNLPGMKHLNQCLKSIEWADEILLLHAKGSDPEIGSGEFPALRSRAIGSPAEAEGYFAAIGTDWVLQLWAEERLEAGLAEELQKLCRDGSSHVPLSYRIPIRSYILGKWAEGCIAGAAPAVRLSRKAAEIPLGWWAKKGSAPMLGRGWIGDYGCFELVHAVDRVQGLSDFWADNLRGMALPPGSMKTVLCSLRVFTEMLFLNRFFARGLAGITLSALASYAVLLSGAKLWEAKRVGVTKKL